MPKCVVWYESVKLDLESKKPLITKNYIPVNDGWTMPAKHSPLCFNSGSQKPPLKKKKNKIFDFT